MYLQAVRRAGLLPVLLVCLVCPVLATRPPPQEPEADRQLVEAEKLFGQSVLLSDAGSYRVAASIAEQAAALYEKALGPEHPDTARALNNLAVLSFSDGQYAKAEQSGLRALAIREKALGPEHPDTAQSLTTLASLYQRLGQYAKTEPLFVRALAIRERVLGPEHADTAESLTNLAVLYWNRSEFAKAEPLGVRGLAIYEKALGHENPGTARALNNLGAIYRAMGQYAKAEAHFQRALAIFEKTLGPEHPDMANSLFNLGWLYLDMGESPVKAEPYYVRALAIREKALGPEHADTGSALNDLAVACYFQRQFSKAEPLLLRAISVREKALGLEHFETAESLHHLGTVYFSQGQFARAEPLFVRALAIREKALGPEHVYTADSLNTLAAFYESQGQYTKAEPIWVRAIAVNEKVLGPDHQATAKMLNNLSLVYQDLGQYAKAEPLAVRVLAISEKTLGPEHPLTAAALGNLALLYQRQGQYAKAEPLLLRVIAIDEKALGSEHPTTALSLYLLATLYLLEEKYAEVEPLLMRSIAINEKTRGPERWTAQALRSLAELYEHQGQFAKAEPLFVRALAIYEKALGPVHRDTATTLNDLAGHYTATGDYPRAVSTRARANEAREGDLLRNLDSGSELEKLQYLQISSREFDRTLSLSAQHASSDPAADRMSLEIILRRKGRALDAMTRQIEALRLRATPDDLKLLDELAADRSALSKLTLAGPGREGVEAYRARIDELAGEVERLQGEIGRRNKQFAVASLPITLDAVRAAIPEGATLVEYASYKSWDAKTRVFGLSRYAVYVTGRDGQIVSADLGEAAGIDALVAVFRTRVRSAKPGVDTELRAAARKLEQAVMEPVRRLAGESRQLLISPDGELNLVPFAALVDEHGKYLVETWQIQYLTSGRDLLSMQDHGTSRSKPLILANPDFAGDTGDVASTRGASFEAVRFRALPGSAREARSIELLLPDARLLTGVRASEAALNEAAGPEVLHLATHGFFVEGGTGDQPDEPESFGGLLRSGVALAGANRKDADAAHDGLVTALEFASLDLWGTKLVVLSACDTGLGESRVGDGVYGLRRAMVLAGSETQVMSLWSVDDIATRELMVAYYAQLLEGAGRAEAMRRVQLGMLEDPRRRHPAFWASFIVSGDWRPLR